MSWGGSIGDFEGDLEKCGIGKTSRRAQGAGTPLFRHPERLSLTRAFASAPGILFVDGGRQQQQRRRASSKAVPSGIVLPNLLTVGAVDSAGEEASFTSYGPTVKVHADGYQVESFLPGGAKVALSGTSMASPEVTNLAGKMFAVNPKLTPTQVIGLIERTADRSADGRRNLVNPKKAVAAAKRA